MNNAAPRCLAIVAVAFFALPNAAQAGSPILECLDAIEADNEDAVQSAAKAVENLVSIRPGEVPRAEKCMTAARGERMRYRSMLKKFLTAEEDLALANQRRAAVAKQQREQERREVEQATQALLAEARRLAVFDKTVEGCQSLYSRDWIAAITSPVCQPIFVEIGLPD